MDLLQQGMQMGLAQAGLAGGFNKVLNLIMMIAFIIGVLVIIYGGWQMKDGDPVKAKLSIIAGAVIAFAVPIMTYLFKIFGSNSSIPVNL
ncbi:MAG: hypothetical protein HRT89_04315 [Lentisphaeria bacterium]|nr:hypothetical protein [Lentisphaeria bacterium]NQZ67275.1 hypothetical protein [Lentisphaeria bacterium]